MTGTNIPRPNPDRAGPEIYAIKCGTRQAIKVADQLAAAESYRLSTWRLHQGNCEACKALPDTDHCGPGCPRGWRIWLPWKTAQERSEALGPLLRDELPEPASAPASDQLTLF